MGIDNPMLLGEYQGVSPPDRMMRCPRCGRIYLGFRVDAGMQWDCGDGSVISASACEPVGNGKCAICAWERRTAQDELAYVKAEIPARQPLAYALCGDERICLRENDSEEILRAVLDAQSEYARELIRDYVADCRRDDFVEWMMGRAGKPRQEKAR